MDKNLHFRALTESDLSQMYRTFVESFSDYSVNMKMSQEAFQDRMLSKLNIRFDLSPGAFSGDKLVGFIFQTAANYENLMTAYNGGTGVISGYRGLGLTKELYRFITPVLVEAGIEQCVLEVLTDNEKAIRAYEKAGFEKSKTFHCLMLKNGVLPNKKEEDIQIQRVEDFKCSEYQGLQEVQPGMIDQLVQVKSHLEKEIILECREGEQLVAYLIFQPSNGRITQVAVKQAKRRKGIATALVHKMYQLCDSKTLSILNIDVKEEGTINFFESLGFVRDLQQYEMQKSLPHVI